MCNQCGGELKPLKEYHRNGDLTYYPGCEPCGIYSAGITKIIYDIAVKMVDEQGFIAYSYIRRPDIDVQPEAYNSWRKSQISGAANFVADVLKYNNELTKQTDYES